MKLTITRLLALTLLASSLNGCGAFSDETRLEIQMYGVTRAPANATGDRDPQFQTYEVLSVTLTSPEGDVELLNRPEAFKIVDRPQILLSHNAEDIAGRSFSGITVVFSPSVVGGDNESSDLTFTLSSPNLTLAQALKVEEGTSKTYSIKANWANTISGAAMSEPRFEIVPN